MAKLLQIENLEKAYAKHSVLLGLSLSLSQGGNLLLNGASGSGKSTLLRLIAGLDTPDRGEIQIEGRLASRDWRIVLPPSQRGLAMVFQDLGLWPNLTARQNVFLGLAGSRLRGEDKRFRAQQALEVCQIASKARQRPHQLSAGEQQRVALARAVAVRPKLLLLDEPFIGLDPKLKDSLLEPVQTLWRQYGTTILLVSHNTQDADALSATVVTLEGGQISAARSLTKSTQPTSP
jgi:ABC-type Fe3+/spermidine/putrescine transport system ATPase subunit